MSKGFTTDVVWVAVWGANRKVFVFRLKRDALEFQEREQGRGRYCSVERMPLTNAVPHTNDEDHEWNYYQGNPGRCWCGQREKA